MKKVYITPETIVLHVSTASMIAVSGLFSEGETLDEYINAGKTIDGNNAWTRHSTIWDDDD